MNMENLEQQLREYYKSIGKHVRPATINTYNSRLKKIYILLNKPEDMVEELMDVHYVVDVLKNNSKSKYTLNTNISSILIYLKAMGVDGENDNLKKYKEVLMSTKIKIEEEKKAELDEPCELLLNKKMLNNIKKKLQKRMKKIKLIKEMEYKDKRVVQEWLVFNLYTLQPPLRNDFVIMKVVSKYDKEMSEEYNYYDRKNKVFVLCNYKNKSRKGCAAVPIIDNKLVEMLDTLYFFTGDGEFLFTNEEGKPYRRDYFLKIIKDVFTCGVSALRKYHISNEFQELISLTNKMKQTAMLMCNSENVILKNYLQHLKEL